ncbi:MAG: helix-turn-helix transcriptional regulator [Acidobacteriota bacterium]
MPVCSTFSANYAELEIGDRIRRHRKRLGWTLRDLAAKVSISAAELSAVENNKKPVRLSFLETMSRVLGVKLQDLYSQGHTGHIFVHSRRDIDGHDPAGIRIVDADRGRFSPYHNRVHPLADPFAAKDMEPFLAEIRPVSEDDATSVVVPWQVAPVPGVRRLFSATLGCV